MGHQLNQELLQKLQKNLEDSVEDGRLGKALGKLPQTEQKEKKTLPLPALEEGRLAKKLQDALSGAVEDGRFGKALQETLQQSNVAAVVTTPPAPEPEPEAAAAQEVAPEVTPEEVSEQPPAPMDSKVQQTFSEEVVQKLRSKLSEDLKAALEDGRLRKALSPSKVAKAADEVDAEEEKVMSVGKQLAPANDDGIPSLVKSLSTIRVPKRDGVMRRLIRFTCGKLSGRANPAIEEAA